MTQEEKDLLLKDLCARLPYHPYINIRGQKTKLRNIVFDDFKFVVNRSAGISGYIDYGTQLFKDDFCYIKPYLRPTSSITASESNELHQLIRESWEFFDYLDSHYFDYRRLIEKGLALEAPKGLYNI